MQAQILAKHLRLFVIDAKRVAREAGLPGRVNTILQTCFFALSGVLPREARDRRDQGGDRQDVREARRGDRAAELPRCRPRPRLPPRGRRPARALGDERSPPVAEGAPDLLRALIAGEGDALPVSALPVDGTFPLGTAHFEKRNLADELPIWDESICIDCAKCALVCPHAAIRMKVYEPAALAGAPAGFRSKEWRAKDLPGMLMTIQVSPDDCTGCRICVETCPAKDKANPEHKSLDSLPKAEHLDARARAAGSSSSRSPRSTGRSCSRRR